LSAFADYARAVFLGKIELYDASINSHGEEKGERVGLPELKDKRSIVKELPAMSPQKKYSRRAVPWAMSERIDQHLALDAPNSLHSCTVQTPLALRFVVHFMSLKRARSNTTQTPSE
jgi:hypothetical protein